MKPHPAGAKMLRRIGELESALKVIHTWATFQQGEAFDRRDVANLCKKALRIQKAKSEGAA
jgi:hypothetical protein